VRATIALSKKLVLAGFRRNDDLLELRVGLKLFEERIGL
jgi:hypothetical protein